MLLRTIGGSAALLLVPLHLSRRTHRSAVRALAELPLGPSLAQQVPALVKRLFCRTKTRPLLFRAQRAVGELSAKLVLGLDQPADPRHDLLLIHVPKVCPPAPGPRSGYQIIHIERTGAPRFPLAPTGQSGVRPARSRP